MAALTVYRVQRNGNYTVMANYHLKDRALSLKAKGLFSVLLSLPEGWDFSLPGLAALCKEGMDAIREAVKELEKLGYIIRSRVRNAKGRLENAQYTLYEKPQAAAQDILPDSISPVKQERRSAAAEEPAQALPTQEKPMGDFPILVFPTEEKPTQNNHPSNPVTPKNINNIPQNPDPDPSYPSRTLPVGSMIPPFFPAPFRMPGGGEALSDPTERLWEIVQQNVGYDALAEEYGREQMDEIVGIIVGVLTSHRICFRFGRDVYPSGLVKKQFFAVNSHHVEYVFSNLKNTASSIHDPKSYLTACIFNATLTMTNHIDAKVRHDTYRLELRDKRIAEEGALDYALEDESPEYWEDIIHEIEQAKRSLEAASGCADPVSPAGGGLGPDRVLHCCTG